MTEKVSEKSDNEGMVKINITDAELEDLEVYINDLLAFVESVTGAIQDAISTHLSLYFTKFKYFSEACSKCGNIRSCSTERVRCILLTPEFNTPEFTIYSTSRLPVEIQNEFNSKIDPNAKLFLIIRLPYMVNRHLDILVKRARQNQKLKEVATIVEAPSLKLYALIRSVFWNIVENLHEKYSGNDRFFLKRLNGVGEHNCIYYYVFEVVPSNK